MLPRDPDASSSTTVRRAGMVVAVYGVDGSGKGTLIASLRQYLRSEFHGVLHVHLFSVQDPDRPESPVLDPHGAPPRSRAASLAKVGWYLARAWLLRRPTLLAALRAGRLVILDRDVPDAALDPSRYRIDAPERVVGLLDRLAPRPDVALVLDADPEDILARSPEVDADRLVRLLPRYRAYAEAHASSHLLDARRTPDEVALEAAELIRSARMGTRRPPAFPGHVPATPQARRPPGAPR